jgi:hypothetical protein
MTHRHKLTRWLRGLGKAEAETAETETARHPRVQKIQYAASTRGQFTRNHSVGQSRPNARPGNFT